jgi:hypothetical protein
MHLSQQDLLKVDQDRASLFATHSGKIVKKLIKRLTGEQVVKERVDWDARAWEHRQSTKNFGIALDNRLFAHGALAPPLAWVTTDFLSIVPNLVAPPFAFPS